MAKLKDQKELFVTGGSASGHCCFEASICAPLYDEHDKDKKYPEPFGEFFDEEDASYASRCINYHHRLREALRDCVTALTTSEYTMSQARRRVLVTSNASDLLAELDNLEEEK